MRMKNLEEGQVIFLGLDLNFIYLVPDDFGPDCWVMAVLRYVASPPQFSVDDRWQRAMLAKQEGLIYLWSGSVRWWLSSPVQPRDCSGFFCLVGFFSPCLSLSCSCFWSRDENTSLGSMMEEARKEMLCSCHDPLWGSTVGVGVGEGHQLKSPAPSSPVTAFYASFMMLVP